MKNIKPLQIKDNIHWAGVLDEDIVTFDIVMETQYGTTYNSYLIDAEKIALIDTVKGTFQDMFLENMKSLINLSEIQYIICNHTEPDHSGSIPGVLKESPDAVVVGSGQALNYLSEMIEIPFKSLRIKDGDTLDLGNRTIEFIGAPNLHWPDTIYSWLKEDNLLFTCDSFGAHYCNEKMFDDQVDNYDDAFEYYFDVILKPYSKFMLKAIEKIKPLDIEMICPGHGPILRSSWKDRVNQSESMAKDYLDQVGNASNQVLITYISAYGFTREMAGQIAEGLKRAGDIKVDLVDIEHISLGDLEEKIVRSNGILIGSPTINRNTLLPVYKMFSVINPLRDKGKFAAAFGSYGWSGEAVHLIEEHLKNLKLEVILQGLSTKFHANKDQAAELRMFGENFGRLFLENL